MHGDQRPTCASACKRPPAGRPSDLLSAGLAAHSVLPTPNCPAGRDQLAASVSKGPWPQTALAQASLGWAPQPNYGASLSSSPAPWARCKPLQVRCDGLLATLLTPALEAPPSSCHVQLQAAGAAAAPCSPTLPLPPPPTTHTYPSAQPRRQRETPAPTPLRRTTRSHSTLRPCSSCWECRCWAPWRRWRCTCLAAAAA